MILKIKLKDIMKKGVWLEFCDMFSINEWAVTEGLMDKEEEFALTVEQAKKLRLI